MKHLNPKLTLFFVFFLILLSLGSAELFEIGSFDNCSDEIFYVDVSSLGSLRAESYNLSSCELFYQEETHHRWRCDCINNSLNISINVLSRVGNSYSVSVMSVSDLVDYELIANFEDLNLHFEGFVQVIPTPDVSTQKLFFQAYLLYLVMLGAALVIILLGFIYSSQNGGFPWEDRTKRAIRLHRKGQNAFESSKHKKAKKYYRKASKLRNK